MSLRPVDLAREAGISTQAVRNYEAAGILPEAPRTESGYRRYEEQHLRALLTYRALAPGFGAETASGIMRGDPRRRCRAGFPDARCESRRVA